MLVFVFLVMFISIMKWRYVIGTAKVQIGTQLFGLPEEDCLKPIHVV